MNSNTPYTAQPFARASSAVSASTSRSGSIPACIPRRHPAPFADHAGSRLRPGCSIENASIEQAQAISQESDMLRAIIEEKDRSVGGHAEDESEIEPTDEVDTNMEAIHDEPQPVVPFIGTVFTSHEDAEKAISTWHTWQFPSKRQPVYRKGYQRTNFKPYVSCRQSENKHVKCSFMIRFTPFIEGKGCAIRSCRLYHSSACDNLDAGVRETTQAEKSTNAKIRPPKAKLTRFKTSAAPRMQGSRFQLAVAGILRDDAVRIGTVHTSKEAIKAGLRAWDNSESYVVQQETGSSSLQAVCSKPCGTASCDFKIVYSSLAGGLGYKVTETNKEHSSGCPSRPRAIHKASASGIRKAASSLKGKRTKLKPSKKNVKTQPQLFTSVDKQGYPVETGKLLDKPSAVSEDTSRSDERLLEEPSHAHSKHPASPINEDLSANDMQAETDMIKRERSASVVRLDDPLFTFPQAMRERFNLHGITEWHQLYRQGMRDSDFPDTLQLVTSLEPYPIGSRPCTRIEEFLTQKRAEEAFLRR